MKTYNAIKIFERDGLKAIIQGDFKDLHSGTKVLVFADGYYHPGTVETRGTGGMTLVGIK